jgi:hypothetical protein
MLKRYGNEAPAESIKRADELAADGDLAAASSHGSASPFPFDSIIKMSLDAFMALSMIARAQRGPKIKRGKRYASLLNSS